MVKCFLNHLTLERMHARVKYACKFCVCVSCDFIYMLI